MLKKKMLIALGVAAVLSVSCVSVTVWAEENAEEQTEEAEDSSIIRKILTKQRLIQ